MLFIATFIWISLKTVFETKTFKEKKKDKQKMQKK